MIQRTAQAAVYAHICMATRQASAEFQYQIEQTHAQALTNLSTVTTDDRQVVVTISNANATLTAEVRAATTLITKLHRQLTL